MTDSIDRLARTIAEMYRQNRPRPSTAPRIGKVVSTSPLKVQWGDRVLLEEDRLVVPRMLRDGLEVTVEGSTYTILSPITAGDEVLIAPDEDLKTWYILGIL
jgi:hypothetical protein